MTEAHTLETFLPLVDTDFTVQADGIEDVLRLVSATPLKARPAPEGQRAGFSLTFHGTRTDCMIANLIEITHPALDPFDIGLSPIAQLPEGAFQYEAVFN